MPVHGSWARGTPASRSANEARRYVFVRPRETTVPSRVCAEIINPARALRSTERGRHRRHLEQVRRAGVRSVGGRSDWHSRLGIRGARWNEPTSDGRACVFATRCSETSDLERVGMAKRARLPGYEGAIVIGRHRLTFPSSGAAAVEDSRLESTLVPVRMMNVANRPTAHPAAR